MATKPLSRDSVSWRQRVGAVFSVLTSILIFTTFLAGVYFLVIAPPSSSRQQHQGESDYRYQQRLQAQDGEQYKDCGFKPTC